MAKATFTVITNRRGACSKSITLQDGKVVKTAAANVYCGLAQRRAVETFQEFNAVVEELGSDQALTYGVPQFARARIVTQGALARGSAVSNAVARDREHFSFLDKRAIMFFDVDRPKDGVTKPYKAKEFDGIMLDLFPWWAATGRMYRPAASAYIYDAETGEELIGGGSLRAYCFIDRGVNIPFVGVGIANKFWKAGLGRIEFSEVGSRLVRCPVDCAIWQPERLDFAGPVVLGAGLKKERHPAGIKSGADIDSEAVIEAAGLGKIDFAVWSSNCLEVREALSAHRPEEKRRKRQTIEDRVAADVAKGANENKSRQKHTRALMEGVLLGDFPLRFTDGTSSVREVLANPGRFNFHRLADPIEPGCYGDPRIAIFFANNGKARPHIFSHAHGGRKFTLAA